MKDFWDQFLHHAKALLSLLNVRSPEERLHERGINEAVERVVDQVNPRLRAVSGYRKQLYPVVERAMVHTRELAQQVPGPILLDRRTWAEDPLVNALFGGFKRMRWVLTGVEVRRYVKEHPIGGDCFALLAVMPEVRQQLGMELTGNVVRRDVRQTTVSFSNHEVALVGESEQEVRDALSEAALELLVGLAEQDITEQESRITELDDRLRILRLKRKVANTRSHGAAFILDDSPQQLKERQKIEARIAELELDLAEERRGLETLDDYLQRLVGKLEHPESLLGLEGTGMSLDRMNIVREGDGGPEEISFTRVRRGDKLMRVVALVRFPRSELLDEEERLRAIDRYLA